MTTLSKANPTLAVKWVLTVVSSLSMAGCGVDFDSSDKINTLRVLAIQKDHPYAAPSEDPNNPSLVNMTMLSHDGTRPLNDPNPPRPIQRIWFSGCDDLPGDLYFSCLARIFALWQLYTANPEHSATDWPDGRSWSPVDDLPIGLSPSERNAALEPLLKQVIPNLPVDLAESYFSTYRIGAGERFTYPIPPRIIENHRAELRPDVPPFGLAFVFFTACAGHIEAAPEWKSLDLGTDLTDATLGFPFLCLDDTGKALGPDDYVSGYTHEFVYGDGSANLNPVIDGLSFDGKPVAADAMCVDGDCVPEPAQTACDVADAPRVPACASKCPKYSVLPGMDGNKKGNDDIDTFASRPGSTEHEQMWIDYYSDRGKIEHSAKSLRDSKLGWFDDHGSSWTPPSDPGPVNVWAVVHDNRGGASWVRLQICVE